MPAALPDAFERAGGGAAATSSPDAGRRSMSRGSRERAIIRRLPADGARKNAKRGASDGSDQLLLSSGSLHEYRRGSRARVHSKSNLMASRSPGGGDL